MLGIIICVILLTVIIGIMVSFVLQKGPIYASWSAKYQAKLDEKYGRLVRTVSRRYKTLNNLLKVYYSEPPKKTEMHTFECVTNTDYKVFDMDRSIIDYLAAEGRYKYYYKTADIFEEYHDKFVKAETFTTEDALKVAISPEKADFKKYHKYEQDMCKELEVDFNDYSFTFTVVLLDSKRNITEKQEVVKTFDEIIEYCGQIDFHEGVKREHKRSVSASQRMRIFKRDQYCCQMCGAKGPALGGTAVLKAVPKVPLSANGTLEDSNIITICSACEPIKKRNEQNGDF